jgi:hypothetical protein
MKMEGRIVLDAFPADWRFYTLNFPVARYRLLSSSAVMKEMDECNRAFYSMPGVAARFWRTLWQRRKPLINLIANLSTMRNSRAESLSYVAFEQHLSTLATPMPLDVAGVMAADSDNRPCAS